MPPLKNHEKSWEEIFFTLHSNNKFCREILKSPGHPPPSLPINLDPNFQKNRKGYRLLHFWQRRVQILNQFFNRILPKPLTNSLILKKIEGIEKVMWNIVCYIFDGKYCFIFLIRPFLSLPQISIKLRSIP